MNAIETKEILKMYELPYGAKVVLMNEETLQYNTMFFKGMDTTNNGVWSLSNYEFKGRLFGTFHYNNSQLYWFYKPDEDENEDKRR